MRLKVIYVDARSLQDEAYRWRGVGQHSTSLLRYGRQILSKAFETQFVAIVDRNLPELTSEIRKLFDRTQSVGYVNDSGDSWFLQLSPMTHSPIHVARMLERGTSCSASIVYDFIPHEMPSIYLKDRAARLNYYNCMSWLRAYDLFLPISNFTRTRLQELIGVAPKQTCTTGVAVRDSLLVQDSASPEQPYRHILAVGGADRRKNIEAPIIAHARSQVLNESGVPLVVAGGYAAVMQEPLYSLHERQGGKRELLRFAPYVDDEKLAKLYQQAIVTVCPSRIEGFSIPIVEASANASPVLVAQCEAQTELVTYAEDQFAADDHERLRSLLERMVQDPASREAACARQSGIWQSFTAGNVADRFWQALLAYDEGRPKRPAVSRQAKPKLAFVTPLPPDSSGVADYSAACLEKLAERAEVHVFSDTVNPTKSQAYASVQPVSSIPYLSKKFDRVVSVVGNSHFHLSIMDKLLRHGGACIVHDARMVNFYAILHGAESACRVASRELGRAVAWEEVQSWLPDQQRLPALFLSEIADAATPMIVHSRISQKLIAQQYRVDATYLPFALYRDFPDRDLNESTRQRAREQLGIAENEVLIGTFGYVGFDKAAQEIIWTIELLRKWGVNARIVFVGRADPPVQQHLAWLANDIGVDRYVKIGQQSVSEAEYRDYLLAADAAIQLHTYRLGGLSGSLLDCIAAVLPTVANAHLAQATDAPSYVHRVPDGISPLLIAEKLMDVLPISRFDDVHFEQKKKFAHEHNFAAYTERLMQALALA